MRELALFDQTIDAYQRAATLTRNQYDAGIVSRADVEQAETQLASAQAQAIDVRLQRAQLEHAIAVLIGEPPASLSLAAMPLDGEPPAGTCRMCRRACWSGGPMWPRRNVELPRRTRRLASHRRPSFRRSR